ncbi:tail fiber domain-containing protein [Burkholderia multivorans]|nr:tail fiber domain-containing protein [Burkholderia multivorans]HEF4751910.1 tail fiber domain-containing protein [Burkholderia multivorans]
MLPAEDTRTATLLPPAEVTFVDQNGRPLAGGQIYFYIPNTTTLKNTWQDSAQTILNTNPVILDAAGRATIWGSGAYRQVVYDQFGNLVWDRITQDANSALSGALTDDVFTAPQDFTPGTSTTLTLTSDPGSIENTWIFFDGVYQADNQVQSLEFPTLTFSSPIPEGVSTVTVKIGNTIAIGTPGSGTVKDSSVAAGSKLYNRINDLIDVRDFGAKGDGTTDDTAAIQAAINYAQSKWKTDFWSTYVPKVYIPSGVYNVKGLAISYPIHLYGDGQNGTTLDLINGSNASVISISDMSETLSGSDIDNIMPIISDMSLGCNSSGQLAGGPFRGISLSDSSVPVGTSYHGGAEIRNVNIRDATQYAIYIGTNRNNGRIANVRTLYSQADGVFSNGYDWRVEDSDFGNAQGSGANGFTQNSGGATEMVNCNLFFNNGSGLYLASGVNASCLFTNCYFDTNFNHGVAISGSYGDIVSHSFSNCLWRDNSQAGDNSYDHINIVNMTQVTIDAATFVVNIPSKQPRYLVNTANVNRVVFNATFEQNDTPNVPYHTAITNNFLNLALVGCENTSIGLMGNKTVGLNGLSGPNFDYYDAGSVSGERRWRTNVSGSVWHLQATDDAGATTAEVLNVTRTGTTPVSINTIPVKPITDNAFPLGDASHRWTIVYATTGTINTSDENEKTDIAPIDDALLDAWAEVDYFTFKFKDSVAAKGTAARTHFGMMAQRVRDAFAKHGIDGRKYGVLCYDEWPEEPAVIDDHGKVIRPAVQAGARWGVRYDQAMILEAALLRRELKSLKAK